MDTIQQLLRGNGITQAVLSARGEGGKVFKNGSLQPDNFEYIRYILSGVDIPVINMHLSEMKAGVLLAELIVNKILPVFLQSGDEVERLIKPFYPADAFAYIMAYIEKHGLQPQYPLMSRTDMLLNANGAYQMIEINCDAPQSYAISESLDVVGEIIEPAKRRSATRNFFHTAQVRYLYSLWHSLGRKPRVVIPYWPDGPLIWADARFIRRDLRSIGFDVDIQAIDETFINPGKYDCVLRLFRLANKHWPKARRLPFFTNEAFLELPQFPAPWTDFGALKHWLAFFQMLMDGNKPSGDYGIMQYDLDAVAAVWSPTYSTHFYDKVYLRKILEGNPGSWISKEVFSAHGDGFVFLPNGSEISNETILQKKVDCFRSGDLIVMHSDGQVTEESGWLIDCNPMGYANSRMSAIARMCPKHPMNVIGVNGGGACNPYLF